MKKVICSGLICAVCLAVLSGCGGEDYEISASGTWADGVYTEEAEGRNGDFDVTVTISGGVMTDISIGENSETEDIGTQAIEQLPEAMLSEQTYDVDGVSGATITSDAIKEAVAECLEEASEENFED